MPLSSVWEACERDHCPLARKSRGKPNEVKHYNGAGFLLLRARLIDHRIAKNYFADSREIVDSQ